MLQRPARRRRSAGGQRGRRSGPGGHEGTRSGGEARGRLVGIPVVEQVEFFSQAGQVVFERAARGRNAAARGRNAAACGRNAAAHRRIAVKRPRVVVQTRLAGRRLLQPRLPQPRFDQFMLCRLKCSQQVAEQMVTHWLFHSGKMGVVPRLVEFQNGRVQAALDRADRNIQDLGRLTIFQPLIID